MQDDHVQLYSAIITINFSWNNPFCSLLQVNLNIQIHVSPKSLNWLFFIKARYIYLFFCVFLSWPWWSQNVLLSQ